MIQNSEAVWPQDIVNDAKAMRLWAFSMTNINCPEGAERFVRVAGLLKAFADVLAQNYVDPIGGRIVPSLSWDAVQSFIAREIDAERVVLDCKDGGEA